MGGTSEGPLTQVMEPSSDSEDGISMRWEDAKTQHQRIKMPSFTELLSERFHEDSFVGAGSQDCRSGDPIAMTSWLKPYLRTQSGCS